MYSNTLPNCSDSVNGKYLLYYKYCNIAMHFIVNYVNIHKIKLKKYTRGIYRIL